MKNKKGFTLVELLAVIAILGIIMTIATSNLLKTKREANIQEAKQLEKMIADLGPGIYTHEKFCTGASCTDDFLNAYKDNSENYYISDDTLLSNGYIKEQIQNPNGSGKCTANLIISEGEFSSEIDCPNLYATGQSGNVYDDSNLSDLSSFFKITDLSNY